MGKSVVVAELLLTTGERQIIKFIAGGYDADEIKQGFGICVERGKLLEAWCEDENEYVFNLAHVVRYKVLSVTNQKQKE